MPSPATHSARFFFNAQWHDCCRRQSGCHFAAKTENRSLLKIVAAIFFIMTSCTTSASTVPPLSLEEEQSYWNAWAQRSSNSPLQPFVTGYTKQASVEVDQLIEQAGSGELQALLIRVNIDSGLADIHYLAWPASKEPISIKGSLLSRTAYNRIPLNHQNLKDRLIKLGEMGDRHEVSSSTLDADTIYLTIRTTDRTARYVSYAPAMPTTHEPPTIEEFVKYIQKMAGQNSRDKPRERSGTHND